MYNIIDLKLIAINSLLRVTLFNQSSLTSLWDRSAFYGYLKNKKNSLTEQNKKKLSEESVEAIKK